MSQITRQYCFTDLSGEDIYMFTLLNAAGTIVTISNFGATITAFKVKNADGTTNDIVLGFENIEDYRQAAYLENYPWFGCAIGRYANRIKDACFMLEGNTVKLSANKNRDQLHGGHRGFDKKVWQLISFGHFPHLFLEMKYVSPDGEEGFPGNLETVIRFELTNNNELSYEYRARTDKATAVNLSHHSYFNLDNGQGTILEHELKIYSNEIIEQDEGLTATGNTRIIEATPFDFRDFHTIGERIESISGYDKSYVVKSGRTMEPRLAAEAKSRKSGICLQVFSTEPVVHFYSGKWIPAVKGKNETVYGPFSGLCLETHVHPNAVNIPGFPNTILKPGEEYHQKTIYKILS